MQTQVLTLELDGITAGDYLAHLFDADADSPELESVSIDAEALGDTVVALLRWCGRAPSPHAAARAAGLCLSQDVVSVVGRVAHPRTASFAAAA